MRWDTIAARVRRPCGRGSPRSPGTGCRYAVDRRAGGRASAHARARRAADAALVTGGSGHRARACPPTSGRRGCSRAAGARTRCRAVEGLSAVLSGSCSAATRGQVAAMAKRAAGAQARPAGRARTAGRGGARLGRGVGCGDGPVLIYATASPEEVQAAQRQLGTELAASRVEGMMAAIARRLGRARRAPARGGGRRDLGGRRPGAGRAGACGSGRRSTRACPARSPSASAPLALALKSGNFGGRGLLR